MSQMLVRVDAEMDKVLEKIHKTDKLGVNEAGFIVRKVYEQWVKNRAKNDD